MATFYKEWLPLDKKEFRILTMLAVEGKFEGNLSDICRNKYFLVTPQTKTRNQIRTSINNLSDNGFIKCGKSGRSYILEIIPKEEGIEIPNEWVDQIKMRDSDNLSVGWESILKVLLWICENTYENIITNEMIAMSTNLSASVICSAKNVLQKEFGAIRRSRVSEKVGENTFRNLGQHLSANGFWAND